MVKRRLKKQRNSCIFVFKNEGKKMIYPFIGFLIFFIIIYMRNIDIKKYNDFKFLIKFSKNNENSTNIHIFNELKNNVKVLGSIIINKLIEYF